jgi:hypothetical protein
MPVSDHTTSGAPGRDAVFVFVIFVDFGFTTFNDSTSPSSNYA